MNENFIIIEENFELFSLLLAENAPTIQQVIDARNIMWDAEKIVNMNVFFNLMTLAVHMDGHKKSEYSAYPVIAEYLGAEILANANQPDLLLNKTIPVEVKIRKFDQKALLQLMRYMKAYNAVEGIAVGASLDVILPSNIKFIKIKFNTDTRTYEVVEV